MLASKTAILPSRSSSASPSSSLFFDARLFLSFYLPNFVAVLDHFVNPKRLINDDVQSNCKNPVLRPLFIFEAIELIESSNSEQEASPLLFNES
jgi:hypothetical protein